MAETEICTTCCGTGSTSIEYPNDPDMHNSVLIAKPTYGGIHLSWTYPEHNPHAVTHTLVFRSETVDPDARVHLGLTNSSHYVDQIDEPATYYYWIQFVSINGTKGPLIGPASATSEDFIERTLEGLTQKIDEGMLAPKLKDIIGRVSENETAIAAERYSRIDADGNLSLAFSDLEVNVGDLQTALIDAQEEFRSADQAMVNTIEGLYASINNNHSLILEEQTVRSSETGALAQDLSTLETTLNGNIAQVQTNVETSIDAVETDLSGLSRDLTNVTYDVESISASYTTVVNVNGLIGGFGIGNDGTTVEAGFDVDRFWVGRTSSDKVKPFIVDNGVAYLDEARIRNASIDTLQIAGNAVTVPATRTRNSGQSTTYWRTYIDVGIYVDEPCYLYSIATGSVWYGEGWGDTRAALFIANTKIAEQGGAEGFVTCAIAGATYVYPGYHKARLEFTSPSGKGTMSSASIFIMGTKR